MSFAEACKNRQSGIGGRKFKKNLVQLLKDCCEALKGSGGIDYILIDSRAGFHDMAGVVTAQIPHGIVLLEKTVSSRGLEFSRRYEPLQQVRLTSHLRLWWTVLAE